METGKWKGEPVGYRSFARREKRAMETALLETWDDNRPMGDNTSKNQDSTTTRW
jgi:hypothetical protein